MILISFWTPDGRVIRRELAKFLLVSSTILDFPTTLTTNKTEKEYYEVKASFNFGFSVRAAGNVEVLLCEGWNPKSYPCYYVSMGDRMVYLRKIGSIDELGKKGANLDGYKVGVVPKNCKFYKTFF